jgi:hypothetical protein
MLSEVFPSAVDIYLFVSSLYFVRSWMLTLLPCSMVPPDLARHPSSTV